MAAIVKKNIAIYSLFLFLSLILVAVLTACGLSGSGLSEQDDSLLGTIVALTMQAMTPLGTPGASQTDLLAATPNSLTGRVEGRVCYTRGAITAMTAYFQNTLTGAVTEADLAAGADAFQKDLPPGSYIAYAWLPDFSVGGLYSACPNGSGCDNHTPLTFTVAAGQSTPGIDLCDWYHGPFDVPYPPGFSPGATVGSISGSIYGYPGGAGAQLTVVAFNPKTKYWYYVNLLPGGRYYTIEGLPPGTYQVVAYDSSGSAGGTSANIAVAAGEDTTADISDWSGSFPSNPVK